MFYINLKTNLDINFQLVHPQPFWTLLVCTQDLSELSLDN